MQTVEGTVFVTLADRKCYGLRYRIAIFGAETIYVSDGVRLTATRSAHDVTYSRTETTSSTLRR